MVGEGPSSPLPGWASAQCPGSGTKGAPPRPRVPPSSSQLGPWSTCDAFLLLCFKNSAKPALGAHSWSLTTRDLPGGPAAQVRPSHCLGSCAIYCLGQLVPQLLRASQGPLCAPGRDEGTQMEREDASEAGTLSGGMTPPSSGARVGVGSLGTFRFH